MSYFVLGVVLSCHMYSFRYSLRIYVLNIFCVSYEATVLLEYSINLWFFVGVVVLFCFPGLLLETVKAVYMRRLIYHCQLFHT